MMFDGVKPERDTFRGQIAGSMKGVRLQDCFFFRDQMKSMGHTSSQCRASKTVNVAEREGFYEESENEECFIRPEDVLDEEEDDQEEAYSYVVRRLMLTTPKTSR
ncbi:Pentatricopeptide repeat-containing protein [Artemisia annua]|uniref:Pentatricopeptide repeat-containing protein n=1 Tax=Artemisia annua TaxID=35608 RepID=A0A2U1M4L9_ARTAN|nr:Pentatricopeptide repeat-containing protein [Artemisia annua]